MNWNLKCRKIRRSLALWAGNDLDDAGRVVAERHLVACPGCREEWLRLRAGRQALESVRSSPIEPVDLCGSIWPRVERQITAVETASEGANWRGWLPVGALAAACLTVMVINTRSPSPYGDEVAGGGHPAVIFSQPADSPMLRGGQRHFDRQEPSGKLLELPENPRVRTLLDGTDLRGL